MNHVWVRTVDGDLLRASLIRQINTEGGLRAILTAGSQFMLAETSVRQTADEIALRLVAAIAAAEAHVDACVLGVVTDEHDNWAVTATVLPAVAAIAPVG